MTESIYPFLPSGASAPPQVFPYDVVINDAFPGIQMIPTEPNGQYQEIREVSGSLWLVTNAQWDSVLSQWDQGANQNTGLPAYALALQGDGSFARYSSPATNIPLTPITWTLLYVIDKNGFIFHTPASLSSGGDSASQTTVRFTAGLTTILNADILFVTDTASAAESSVQLIEVNGTPVWKVRKDGFLEIGTVPATAVTGVFNNATFTGTSTFNGPVIENGAVTANSTVTMNSTLDVVGHTQMTTLDATGTSVFHGIIERVGGAPVVGLTSPDNSILVGVSGQNYTVETEFPVIGSVAVNYANQTGPTAVTDIVLPGSSGNTWTIVMQAEVVMTAPLVTGTVTMTPSGATGPDQSWNTNPISPVTNPGQAVIPIIFGGDSSGGATITATFSSTGGTIGHVQVSFVATRFS